MTKTRCRFVLTLYLRVALLFSLAVESSSCYLVTKCSLLGLSVLGFPRQDAGVSSTLAGGRFTAEPPEEP